MKTKALDKLLENHTPTCTIHIYSADVRKCSCGRNDAIMEKGILLDALKWLFRAHQYLEDHDAIAANSEAGEELEAIIERAKNAKIIKKEDA